MKTVTISTLKREMKEHFDYVSKSMEVIIVPGEQRRRDCSNMSLKKYNSLIETEYLLSTKSNRKRLQESISQINEGNTIPYTLN